MQPTFQDMKPMPDAKDVKREVQKLQLRVNDTQRSLSDNKAATLAIQKRMAAMEISSATVERTAWVGAFEAQKLGHRVHALPVNQRSRA